MEAVQEAPLVMRLWAKTNPFQPLPCHLVDVGYVALELLKTNAFRMVKRRFAEATACPVDAVDSWIGYLVALHDWGKCWRNFQGRAPAKLGESLLSAGLNLNVEEQEKSIRHEVISRLWVEEHLESWAGWTRRAARTVGAAIAAHHGRLGQDLPQLFEFDGRDKWEVLRTEVEEMVRAVFRPEPWRADFVHHSVAGMLLAGLIVWADWIASNEQLFPLRWNGEGWLDYIDLSRIAARQAVQRLGLGEENPWQLSRTFAETWPNLQNPRPIQLAMEDLVQTDAGTEAGLVIIEAPMGEGKSEAALYLATRWIQDGGGLYVALPTAATSNQMFDRVRRFLKQHDAGGAAALQLVHGASWLVDDTSFEVVPEIYDEDDDADGQVASEWFRPRKRSLLATYGVGTIDQALMAVLHVKHGFLRLLGLVGKVLIVDEVHAYDAYMSEMLTLLLSWCRALGIRVILLSATLPRSRREALIAAYSGCERSADSSDGFSTPYPLVTVVKPSGEVVERSVEPGKRRAHVQILHHEGMLGDAQAVAKLAVERLGNEGCLCVIANTVGLAQAIFEELKRIAPDVPKLLLHSRFLARDRQRIEKKST